jgi:hypothetical protein
MNEIKSLKARIDQIDKQIGDLQSERLLTGLRFQLLLKQNALANPQPESLKVMATWADARHAPGRTGFEIEEFEEQL